MKKGERKINLKGNKTKETGKKKKKEMEKEKQKHNTEPEKTVQPSQGALCEFVNI